MKILIGLLLALLLPAVVYSGQVTQGDLKVVKVMARYSGGEAYFFVNEMPENPNSCQSPHNGYYILAVDPQESDVSQVLSILLTAKASQSSVEIQVYDDSCFNGHAVIRRVAIY